MPLYEYQCDACGQRFEVIRKFSDAPDETCRHCGKGPVRRLASSPAIQFKGSGFYITDYPQKGKPSGETPSEAKGEEKKSDTPSSDKVSSDKASSEKSPAPATPAPAAQPKE